MPDEYVFEIEDVWPDPVPWTNAWEDAYNAFQLRHSWDAELAKLRGDAMRENDARYLLEDYFPQLQKLVEQAGLSDTEGQP
jgi:hypothetical protein